MDNTDRKELASAERRNFLKLAATGGFTAALVAGAAGTLWSTEAAAQSANEEREREAAAEHVMTIGTAYVLGASRSYPLMQLDLKENIQNATNGKGWRIGVCGTRRNHSGGTALARQLRTFRIDG